MKYIDIRLSIEENEYGAHTAEGIEIVQTDYDSETANRNGYRFKTY